MHFVASSSRTSVRRIAAFCAGLFAFSPTLCAEPSINEIMFRPGPGYPENTALEFVEIHNPGTAAVDLSGWAITKGVDFTFPAGTSLAAGGYLIVAADPTALKSASAAATAATVVGPWQAGARLANNGETVVLAKPGATAGDWTTVDSIEYANEGDWATRTRDSLGGWSWVSAADGGGSSLERRNPALAKNTGQNWGASTVAGGTPGAINSLHAANVAPLITGVKHGPAVPRSTDPVTISANLTDETPASSLTATLYWREATAEAPGEFQTAAMAGNGSGTFTAILPPMADRTIVEFYVLASDGTLTRTWPAPTSEGQNANCTYQVDNEVIAGPAPSYRIVLTAAENSAFNTYTGGGGATPGGGRPGGGGGPGGIGDRQFNFTLVVSRGDDTTIRYLASMRVRGNSSRNYTIKPLRISLPADRRWDGVSDFMINSRGAPVQFLAMRAQRAAGLVAADASPIEVRRQGVEYTVSTGNAADHGQLVRIEELNGDYLDRHFPLAISAQLYRKVSISGWANAASAPSHPDATWSGWSKQSSRAANDWSDVMNFSRVWQDTAAAHFSGASAGNVAAGTWDGTPFTDAEVATLATVADLDYLARWLATMAIMPNGEENLATGEDDDYAAAFVGDGTHTRMIPVPHDMDTTFGLGEVAVAATAKGLYDATEIFAQTGGGFPDTLMKPLQPLLGDRTRPGNAAFREKYLTALRELLGSVFDADPGTNANPPFHQFVDRHLAWTPASYRTQIKTFMTQRQAYLLGLVGAARIAPPAPTSAATLAAAGVPALRLNEVLAVNTTIANGATFPDFIELYNGGSTAIDLEGRSLSDTTATPRKFTFAAGTRIAAGGYLVVYADTDTTAPGLHTGFALDAEGDRVLLYDTAAAGGALLDSIAFGFQIPDHSVSRTGAAADLWALATPTPAAANGAAAPLGAPAAVTINEWAGRITFRVDHDFIELHNSAAQPVALGGVRLTDDAVNHPSRFAFPALSFVAPGGFLSLFGADLPFGLDGDFDLLALLGENGAAIDLVDFIAQPADRSTGRRPDGAAAIADFAVPTPGLANATALPAAYAALLEHLRVTELMFQPVAAAAAGDYEFIELQNIGATTLDLSGVRFTNGLDYTFPAGTTLDAGSHLVVARNRTAFAARYPGAVATLAPGQFAGALDNSGENIALTLPAPWYVHILKFRYESNWSALAAGGGYSLVIRAPGATAAWDWGRESAWRAATAVNGNPGAADAGGVSVTLGQASGVATAAGGATTLGVRVSADGAVSYQWQILTGGQWVDVAGATAATHTIRSTQTFHAGTYRALVTAAGNTVASEAMTVAVTPVASSGARLVNLATRAQSLAGASALVPGFVIAGSGSKRLLIRNVGPTLAAFGVTGALADPQLVLQRHDPVAGSFVTVAANDNWGTTTPLAGLTNATAALGAFSLSAGSADSALIVDLVPGQYTATASGADNATGVALVELYDADTATPTARLSNIATRGYVGTGGDIIAAGFVISGAGARTVLVRAIGPTLAGFGLTGVLADPQLAIYRASEAILANDDWSAGPATAATAATAAQVGAFALPAGSKDAAFVVTLPAGAYTVQVSGAGGTTGIALVEIYEAP